MKVSEEVARRFANGDELAVQEVYETYRSLLFFIIVSIVKNEEDAKDLLQETFIKALANASKLVQMSAFERYLTLIAKNLALNFVRDHGQECPLGSLLEIYGEEDHSNSLLQEMNSCLSDRENVIVSYALVYGYSFREIALLTGVSKSQVHALYQGALKKMKAHYQGGSLHVR